MPRRDRVPAERAVPLQDGTHAKMQGARGNRATPPTASWLFALYLREMGCKGICYCYY